MLTSDQSIVVYDDGLARPDRLTRKQHGHYLRYAERMLAIYRAGIGRRRRELHRDVQALFDDEPDCEPRRIAAFCKLLDELAAYHSDARGAAALRLRVFAVAAEYHPLVGERSRLFDHVESEVKSRIAAHIGRPWTEIERDLYADVISEHRLVRFGDDADAERLLSRYNVAQVQACLYRAERATILARDDLKTILRHAKLARLLHRIARLGPAEYRIDLDGPASVLWQTRRYGVDFAKFLTALLSCRGWQLTAWMRAPWGQPARLELSGAEGLKTPVTPPEEFDSSVEAGFADKFGTAPRDGWRLERETEVLFDGQTVFVPDFVFRHEDGTVVLLEIVGFWTPEYLAAKRETLRRFRKHHILVAVAEANVRQGALIPDGFITYKTALKLEPVMVALEQARPPSRNRAAVITID